MAEAKVTKNYEAMNKSEIFAKILSAVSTATDVPPGTILSSNICEDTVDARYILVHLLGRHGFYPSQTASMMGCTRRCVNKLLSNFSTRVEGRHLMRINLEHTLNILGTDKELAGNG